MNPKQKCKLLNVKFSRCGTKFVFVKKELEVIGFFAQCPAFV